jgi:hypothetical protein
MGQAVRVMKYDRAANEQAAVAALSLGETPLAWFRLDDGIMGGQSETLHSFTEGVLHFEGTINTSGGGFCSLRTKLPVGFDDSVTGIRLVLVGDGKTYKFFLSDGQPSTGGPFGRTPSWQRDIATKNNVEQDVTIKFEELIAAFGGRSSPPNPGQYSFDKSTIREMGIMLSLKLSDGGPNPVETFGEGIFPFSLQIKSIDTVK